MPIGCSHSHCRLSVGRPLRDDRAQRENFRLSECSVLPQPPLAYDHLEMELQAKRVDSLRIEFHQLC